MAQGNITRLATKNSLAVAIAAVAASGSAQAAGEFDNRQTLQFTPPSEGFGSDWVLVLDDASKSFDAPGTPLRQ